MYATAGGWRVTTHAPAAPPPKAVRAAGLAIQLCPSGGGCRNVGNAHFLRRTSSCAPHPAPVLVGAKVLQLARERERQVAGITHPNLPPTPIEQDS